MEKPSRSWISHCRVSMRSNCNFRFKMTGLSLVWIPSRWLALKFLIHFQILEKNKMYWLGETDPAEATQFRGMSGYLSSLKFCSPVSCLSWKPRLPLGCWSRKALGLTRGVPLGLTRSRKLFTEIRYTNHYFHPTDLMVDVNMGAQTLVPVFTHSTPSLFRLASIP